VLAAVFGLVAMTTLLTACDKPKPTITVLSDSQTTVVPAQPTCTIQPTNPCDIEAGKQRTITARTGGQLLLDVSPQLADNGYVVAAYTSDGKTNTPLSTPGASTGPLRKQLTVKLAVPPQAQGSYFLQISALPPSKQFTTWLVLVKLSA
jgi:hypothetical protein